MIGIICAMENEAQTVLDNLDIGTTYTAFGKKFYTGRILGKPVALAISGVGKVNATMAAQYLLDTYKEISVVLNIGVCGGVRGKVELGEIYLVSAAAQYDFDTTEIDDVPPGYMYGLETAYIDLQNAHTKKLSKLFPYAKLVTGDRFTGSQEVVDFIENNFGAELREMEGGAIAQVCAFHKKDCVMLKGVSDYVGAESVNLFEKYCQTALAAMSRRLTAVFAALCG